VTEANPFREAARRTWLAAEAPDLETEDRDRLMRLGQWYEEEAARWDLRRGLVPTPRASDEALPRRVPGQSWEALTGVPLEAHRTADWHADEHRPSLHRMVAALRRHPP
jgi:hypothetical protein